MGAATRAVLQILSDGQRKPQGAPLEETSKIKSCANWLTLSPLDGMGHGVVVMRPRAGAGHRRECEHSRNQREKERNWSPRHFFRFSFSQIPARKKKKCVASVNRVSLFYTRRKLDLCEWVGGEGKEKEKKNGGRRRKWKKKKKMQETCGWGNWLSALQTSVSVSRTSHTALILLILSKMCVLFS